MTFIHINKRFNDVELLSELPAFSIYL